MRFSLTIKLFLIVVLVFAGIFNVSFKTQAALCGRDNEPCTTDPPYTINRCCTGTICGDDDLCHGGLFTKGQSAECMEEGNCSRCDFLIIVKNIFQLLVQVAGALAVLSIVVAGVMYMMGGGALGALTTQAASPGVQKAKNALTAAIVGLLIVLFAWSMITWMMHFLGYKEAVGHSWWSIQCGVEYEYKCSCYKGNEYLGGTGPYSKKEDCEAICDDWCKDNHPTTTNTKCETY